MTPAQAPEPAPETPPAPSPSVRVAFAVLFAIAIALAGYVVSPFRAPLFLALVLASVLYGVYEAVVRWVRGRRVLGAVITTAGLLLVIIGPVAAIVGFVAGQMVVGIAFVRERLGIHSVAQLERGALSPRAQELVDRALHALHLSRAQIQEMASYATTAAEHATQAALATSSRAAFQTAIMLIAFYFFLLEGARILRWVTRVSPLQPHQTQDLLDELRRVARASILGAAVAALFQGVMATFGYWIAGVPYQIFFGVLTLVASFIPVVGTLIVWAPAAALLWVFGHHGSSLALVAWCLVFVAGAEQIGKPLLLRALRHGGEEMHTGLVFLSLLGGIEMFGLIGLVLGPLAIALFLAMVRIYERDFRPRAAR
jgi:predicted PurR-regulated permease PerM